MGLIRGNAFLLVISLFFLLGSGCILEPRREDNARPDTVSAPERKVNSNDTAPGEIPAKKNRVKTSSSGKMTSGGSKNRPLRLGMGLKFSKIPKESADKLAEVIRSQISIFAPCIKETGKGQVVRINSEFTLSGDGLPEGLKLTEVEPFELEFSKCFSSQIEQLDVGTGYSGIKVLMEVGTYYGDPDGWKKGDPKHE